MGRNRSAGRLLAERHQQARPPDTARSLLDVAETARGDDWTLRSALVRVAQRDPVRAAAVLEAVRRCDAAVQPLRRSLEQHVVMSDPLIDLANLQAALGRGHLDEPAHPVADVRVADLARLIQTAGRQPGDPAGELLSGYQEVAALSDDEWAALPFLSAAIELDRLSDALTDWARTATGPVPTNDIDQLSAAAQQALDSAGAPVEQGPTRAGASRDRPG